MSCFCHLYKFSKPDQKNISGIVKLLRVDRGRSRGKKIIIQYTELNQNKDVFEESVVSERIQDGLKQ